MAGAAACASVIVPYSRSMVSMALSSPGMATDWPPRSFHSSWTSPSLRNRSSPALAGATPRASSAKTF